MDLAQERAALLEVYRQCEDFLALGPVAQASAEMVAADLELAAAEGAVFCAIGADASGQMLGVVSYACGGCEGDPTLALLSLLMIAAPYRGLGLGAAVTRLVEGDMARNGARAIQAGVQVNNPAAIRFWQRQGYQIVSGPEEMGDGTIVLRLWKAISVPDF